MKQRTARLEVRLYPEEKAAIVEAAKTSGMSPSSWTRAMALVAAGTSELETQIAFLNAELGVLQRRKEDR